MYSYCTRPALVLHISFNGSSEPAQRLFSKDDAEDAVAELTHTQSAHMDAMIKKTDVERGQAHEVKPASRGEVS
jgi:hypothetical protein